MKVRFIMDNAQAKSPAGIDVTRKFRDLAVSEVRTKLLAGAFANNPDDLEVTGEAKADSIVITAKDLRSKKEASKAIILGETEAYTGTEDAGDQPKRRISEDEFFGRIPEAAFSKKISDSQFQDHRSDDLAGTVKDKLNEVAKDFLKAFYEAKAGG